MAKRCQVCDGPVVNGRCKLCGMPYRNDELTYHLNEDRSEHYKHASERVRREMRLEELPLPDRTAAQKASYGNRASHGKTASQGKTASYGKNVSQGTAQKTVYGSASGRTAPRAASKERKAGSDRQDASGKRKSGKGLAVLAFLIGLSLLSNIMERGNMTGSVRELTADSEIRESRMLKNERIDTSALNPALILDWKENRAVEAGLPEDGCALAPGLYLLEHFGGTTTLGQYDIDGGQPSEFKLSGEGAQALLEMKEGDLLSIDSLDNKYNFVLVYPIEQYDE